MSDRDRAEALTAAARGNYDCDHPGARCGGCVVKIDGKAMLDDLREAGWVIIRAEQHP